MTDVLHVFPAGWYADSADGTRRRWWDGSAWTDRYQDVSAAYAPPPPPASAPRIAVVRRTASARAAAASSLGVATPASKNGPATASLVLILFSVLGALAWAVSGASPGLRVLIALAGATITVAALVLAVAGLVVAVRRPTGKRESALALVLSGLMAVAVAVQLAVLASAPAALGRTTVESTIAAQVRAQTGQPVTVACPASPPATDGAAFRCTVVDADGLASDVDVRVQGGKIGWTTAP